LAIRSGAHTSDEENCQGVLEVLERPSLRRPVIEAPSERCSAQGGRGVTWSPGGQRFGGLSAAELGRRFWERYVTPDHPGTLAANARARRWGECLRRFPDLADMRVIDLGGYDRNWAAAPVRPRHVTVVNLDGAGPQEETEACRVLRADACDLPADLFEEPFDLVYSNSLLEHLGGRWRRQAFAHAVDRLAPHYWIQTPSPTFPIEPHWLFPAFHVLPTSVQARVATRWPFGSEDTTRKTLSQTIDACLAVELVSATEMRALFPGAELLRERAFAMTKSLIAVR
jgi:hypothetical protein